ncbi:MAG: RNA-binding cell elongation regulator Jag/EloR [Anaerolineaceae bacterium]|jgi:spoIIIJ-associated protein|nr:RNA-binding cell elongation regulator Jag/EloR [Anaerolineaceae bacterium]
MEYKKITQEFIAPTVEEAIEQGAKTLGMAEELLDVEILDQGSKGLFGLGSRQARVRLSIRNGEEQRSEPKPKPKPKTEAPVPTAAEPINTEKDPVLKLAEDVVWELLQKMHIEAKVEAKFIPPIDERDQRMVQVEILGRDLSILIGRRSETLNALQYISSLIVAKEHGEWIPLMIDVQGYRERRERQLKVLARRMAEQVVHTGRRQNLEPMPANERRVIHIELRNHDLVSTESVGEEPNRKVTIILKKQK